MSGAFSLKFDIIFMNFLVIYLFDSKHWLVSKADRRANDEQARLVYTSMVFCKTETNAPVLFMCVYFKSVFLCFLNCGSIIRETECIYVYISATPRKDQRSTPSIPAPSPLPSFFASHGAISAVKYF